MPERIEVAYFGDDIDSDFDKAVEGQMKNLGYKRYASGYDLIKNRRDIAFEKSKAGVRDAKEKQNVTET